MAEQERLADEVERLRAAGGATPDPAEPASCDRCGGSGRIPSPWSTGTEPDYEAEASRWPECEGPACGYRHDPNLPCFTDATDHDSVPGSTDTAGDPSAFLPDDLVATARRIGCTLAEQLADEVERLRAAQINRPAPDPDLLAEAAVLLRRGLAPSMWRADGTPEQQITPDEWYQRRDAWLALFDAGEPD